MTKQRIEFVISCFIFGCSGGNSSDTPKASFQVKDLAGTWEVGCTSSQLGQIPAFRKASLKVTTDGSFEYENKHFQDAACTTLFYTETSKGVLQVGDAIDESGRKITLTASQASAIAQSSGVSESFNYLSVCGFSDWTVGQAKNILNTGCVGWSESTATSGVDLTSNSDGVKLLRVFYFNTTKQRAAGNDFKKVT